MDDDQIVQVALDTTVGSGCPDVIVIPHRAPAGEGQCVRWRKIDNEFFNFYCLKPSDTAAIYNINVTDDEITAMYSDTGAHEYEYEILVKDARGKVHQTVAIGGVDNGGSPTIRNR
jgi:hypothetical protein